MFLMAVDFHWDIAFGTFPCCLFLVVLLFVSRFVVHIWICILYATLLLQLGVVVIVEI
jgi:hypothetical protein